MKLISYLKKFKNICWYPSAGVDLITPFFIEKSFKFNPHEVDKNEIPSCYIFTDYKSSLCRIDELIEKAEKKEPIVFKNNSRNFQLKVNVLDFKELEPLDNGFDQKLVTFEKDSNYNRVFVFDVEIKSIGPNAYKPVKTKLIYVITENTEFCFNFLLKNNLNVKHFIHKCYGNGFGGGHSTGCVFYKLLSKLNTKYVIKDDAYTVDREDIADSYLCGINDIELPELKYLNVNYTKSFGWAGYRDVKLFEVENYLKTEKA